MRDDFKRENGGEDRDDSFDPKADGRRHYKNKKRDKRKNKVDSFAKFNKAKRRAQKDKRHHCRGDIDE